MLVFGASLQLRIIIKIDQILFSELVKLKVMSMPQTMCLNYGHAAGIWYTVYPWVKTFEFCHSHSSHSSVIVHNIFWPWYYLDMFLIYEDMEVIKRYCQCTSFPCIQNFSQNLQLRNYKTIIWRLYDHYQYLWLLFYLNFAFRISIWSFDEIKNRQELRFD